MIRYEVKLDVGMERLGKGNGMETVAVQVSVVNADTAPSGRLDSMEEQARREGFEPPRRMLHWFSRPAPWAARLPPPISMKIKSVFNGTDIQILRKSMKLLWMGLSI